MKVLTGAGDLSLIEYREQTKYVRSSIRIDCGSRFSSEVRGMSASCGPEKRWRHTRTRTA